jgi:hypothetical protein
MVKNRRRGGREPPPPESNGRMSETALGGAWRLRPRFLSSYQTCVMWKRFFKVNEEHTVSAPWWNFRSRKTSTDLWCRSGAAGRNSNRRGRKWRRAIRSCAAENPHVRIAKSRFFAGNVTEICEGPTGREMKI